MEQDLHHPAPQVPYGWRESQAENIDITTTSDVLSSGRHSRSPSVLSNSHFPALDPHLERIQPSNVQHAGQGNYSNDIGDQFGLPPRSNSSQFGKRQDVSQFGDTSANDPSFPLAEISSSSDGSNGYFHPGAGTAASTATETLHTLNNALSPDDSNSNLDDFYLSSTDLSITSPFLRNQFVENTTSPPINDSLSPFAPYHHQLDPQENTFPQQYDYTLDSNSLNLHWTHHRSRSDQSDISSNASPFVGSVHSEQGSPYIGGTELEDDLHTALLDLDMGAQYDVASYNTINTFDPSNLELDRSGFPLDAPVFDRDTYRDYYDRQSQHGSRPASSSGYQAQPSYTQSIFQHNQPANISTTIAGFQSPPLPSATSIPEIQVTGAPPTPGSFNNFDSYFPSNPRPYNPQPSSVHNSPSFPPNFIFHQSDITPLALPPQAGRRRAVSDSGTRPSMPPPTALSRRVSSGSHPYLAVQDSGPSSGRSTPARGHRKSYSSGSHNMTHRDVLDLVKNDGPREAKNPKKFICDYPGCGQRFTRNSNKTTHMLTHTNERPHVCPHCQKDFTRQHDWKRHMELHDPSKKFKCSGTLADGRVWGCNKEFARKDALSRHFKSQQGRQCIDEVLREGQTLEDIYDQQGLSMLSGNSSEDMYEES